MTYVRDQLEFSKSRSYKVKMKFRFFYNLRVHNYDFLFIIYLGLRRIKTLRSSHSFQRNRTQGKTGRRTDPDRDSQFSEFFTDYLKSQIK